VGILPSRKKFPRRSLCRFSVQLTAYTPFRSPAHTSIGIISSLITTLENAPFKPTLSPQNPFSTYAQCLAEHADIDNELRNALTSRRTWDKAARLLADRKDADSARLSTTQAVDIIYGGVKVNALPEQVTAIVNHRVSVDSSVKEVRERYVRLLTPEAERFNLTLVGFDETVPENATRYVKLLSPFGAEASPVTPASGGAWDVFFSAARQLWGEDAIVSPYLMNGGTDTRAYWNLTRAIYRFQPLRQTDRYNIHTVDERVHIDGHLNTIRWFYGLIRNADHHQGE